MRRKELQDRNATDGYDRMPICLSCFKGGKKVLKLNGLKQNQTQAQKEKNAKKKEHGKKRKRKS